MTGICDVLDRYRNRGNSLTSFEVGVMCVALAVVVFQIVIALV
ncbi:MAG: hypothetical protein QF554_02660 [Dehalococcoidia bacterium]|jgi:hypothetical protein|nr:hypothetical protein [Dehalococcoidia bacterium]